MLELGEGGLERCAFRSGFVVGWRRGCGQVCGLFGWDNGFRLTRRAQRLQPYWSVDHVQLNAQAGAWRERCRVVQHAAASLDDGIAARQRGRRPERLQRDAADCRRRACAGRTAESSLERARRRRALAPRAAVRPRRARAARLRRMASARAGRRPGRPGSGSSRGRRRRRRAPGWQRSRAPGARR